MVPWSLRWRPDELFVCLLCILSGTAILASRNEPPSLEAVLPSWMVSGWAAGLVLLCSTIAATSLWPRPAITALLLHRGASIMFAGLLISYALAVLAYSSTGAAFVAGLCLALAAARLLRALEIHCLLYPDGRVAQRMDRIVGRLIRFGRGAGRVLNHLAWWGR